MAIRETLQKNPVAATVAAALLIVIFVFVIRFELKGQSDFSNADKLFYSDDDGKTWFLDDPAKGSPIDYDGKKAYRALVYRCPGGQPFVAYLAKFSDHQIAQMASDDRVLGLPMHDLKKPGESKWVKNSASASEGAYPPVSCPGGGGSATMVSPLDPDSGATR
jgi:hypothetical protein